MKTKALIYVTLFSFFWALCIFITKLALIDGMDVLILTIHSLFIAWIFFVLVVLRYNLLDLKKLNKKLALMMIFIYIVQNGIGIIASNIGIEYTTATNAAFLLKSALVFVIILSFLFLGEKLTKTKIIGSFIMIFGMFLLTTKAHIIVPHIGDLWILLGAFCFATANVYSRHLLSNKDINPNILSLFKYSTGVPFLLFLYSISDLYPSSISYFFDVNLFDFTQWYYSVTLGISGALLTYYLNLTLKVAHASYMTMMSMMTPVMVSMLAFIFIDEKLEFIQALGATFIIFSAIYIHFRSNHH